MRLVAICAGTGMGQWGQLVSNCGVMWTMPPKASARTDKLLPFYFRFVFIGEKAKGREISGLKPTRKQDLGYPGFLSIMNDTGKCQLSPPSLKIVPAS